MADIFDVNQYKSENSRLTLKPEQKSMITAKMYQAYKAMKKSEIKPEKHYLVKGMAAVLAVALIVGVGFVGFANHNNTDNWFLLTVSAAATPDEYASSATDDETKNTGVTDADFSGYSDSVMSGFFMEDEAGTLTKNGCKDYFACFLMENLSVTGGNIKSVRFESQKKGIYFSVAPSDNSVDYLSDIASIDYALGEYKERTALANSQYSFDELKNKAPFLIWPCDGFTYDNGTISTGEEENILPLNHIDIILESDHSDPEISKWLREMSEIKDSNHQGSEKFIELEGKIQKKMLENAEITVTVTYADGETDTKAVSLAYKGYRSLELIIKK